MYQADYGVLPREVNLISEINIRGSVERVVKQQIPKEWEETHNYEWQHNNRVYDATFRLFKTRATQQYPEPTIWLSLAYRNQYAQVRATEANIDALIAWLEAVKRHFLD
jgi:hypothetical protein